ncbi:hypothetical protein LTS18_009369, partial [Coniosporium uncinatum]
METSLDQETRENLAKSHSASKSLIYVINDLLDLTKTEEGGDLVKGEAFEVAETLKEATDMFKRDAQRKNLSYEIIEHPGLPKNVIGDQRKVRQAISNLTVNAIQNTRKGRVKVEMYVVNRTSEHVDIEVVVEDTGGGMSSQKLDSLFNDLEQVQDEETSMLEQSLGTKQKTIEGPQETKRTLGLGLAIVARIIRNMNGQLRVKSEAGKGSRFTLQFPFELPDSELNNIEASESRDSTTPQPSLRSKNEVTLVDRDQYRSSPTGSIRQSSRGSITRKDSADSLSSRKSLKSLQSQASGASAKSAASDVDRLISAIQQPHMIDREERSERGGSSHSSRPRLEKSHSVFASPPGTPTRVRSKSLENVQLQTQPEHQRSMTSQIPGKQKMNAVGTPMKAVKMPDEVGSPMDPGPQLGRILGEETTPQAPAADSPAAAAASSTPQGGSKPDDKVNADNMSVLIAEDDPVNSRIIKKRLERLGHITHLTVNGEECASAYGEKRAHFDVVLMDMQMPIVDGLTATRMIRSFEKTDPAHLLTQRASLNGRVPIIAVSASLIEKERQQYIDAGFDGWILKPISFPRLNELMTGIIDQKVREEALYAPGQWERGGWFEKAQPDVFGASTTPQERVPFSGPSNEVQEAAKDTNNPTAGARSGARQDR